MESVSNAKSKLADICEALKKDAIAPAQEESGRIIDDAKKKADEILQEAYKQAKKSIDDANECIKSKKQEYETELRMAVNHSLQTLKQAIADKLLNEYFSKKVANTLTDESTIASFISVVMESISKEGFDKDPQIFLNKNINKARLLEAMAKSSVSSIKESNIKLEGSHVGLMISFDKESGGVSIEVTDQSLKSLFSSFVRKEFYDLIFQKG